MISLKSIRAKIIVAALGVAAALLGSEASAQSIAQPPVASVVDANGVNLATGLLNLPGLDISIGGKGSGISRQTQTFLDATGNIKDADNFSGTWAISYTQTSGNVPASAGVFFVYASVGGQVHRFLLAYGDYNNPTYPAGPYMELGGQSVLTCSGSGSDVRNGNGTCTLKLSDGTSVYYNSGYMYGITKSDGEVISITYSGANWAINTVSSSLGWTLKYTVDSSYKVIGVTAVNSSVTPCTPSSCSVASSFPNINLVTNGATRTISQNGITLGSYTINGNTVTLTSPGGVTKTVTLSGGKVASVYAGGQTWTYSYGSDANNNNVTTVTAPNGTTRKVAMDPTGVRVIYQTDEAGRTTTNTYGTGDLITKIVSPDGDANTGGFTLFTYDSQQRLIETDVVPKGGATNGTPNAGAAIVTRAEYDATCDTVNFTNIKWCRKPTRTYDANGVVTYYTYDASSGGVGTVTFSAANGAQAQIRNTYSPQTPHAYDLNGNMVAQPVVYRFTATSSCMTANLNACVGGADERKSVTTYNSSNVLPISVTTSRGDGSLAQTQTKSYNDNGWMLVSDGPKPGAIDETYYFYDALGRQVGMVGMDPDGTGSRHRHATHTSYDNDGHVQEIDIGIVGNATSNVYGGSDAIARNGQAYSDWAAMTPSSSLVQERKTTEFDGYGRPVISRHYIGNATTAKDVTQRSYDSMQRADCDAVRLNSADYGNLGNIAACSLGTTGADGSQDRITKYAYDTLNHVSTTTSAYGTAQARIDSLSVYDIGSPTSTGTLSYVEDANGNRTSYFYDSFDRAIESCYPLAGTIHASSTTDCAHTAYRSTTLTGVTQAGTLASSATLRDTQVINFGYDVLGRLANKTGAVSETFSYDNFGQVLIHSKNGHTSNYTYNSLGWLTSDAQAMGTVAYYYDGYGRRIQMNYPGSGINIVYNYYDGDELNGIWENGATELVAYDYDDYGRRSHLYRNSGVTTTYNYDSNLRLGSLTQGSSGASFYNVTSFGYNAADEIASKSGTNAAYNYTPAAKAIGYGINGLNQIASVNGTNFSYDARGNLSGDGSGSVYSYNNENLLTSAQQSGVTTNLYYDAEDRLVATIKNGVTTQFLYDGSDLIAEYDGGGNLLKRYVHGPGDDEPLVSYDYTNGGAKTYLHADDNGSIVLLTSASGGQTAINKYDEYGLPDTNNSGRFQYTGQVWLPELQMYYYKARIYSPILGRFLQTDPIGYGDGMNWYAYAGDDPVNGSDPTGLDGDKETHTSNCISRDSDGAVSCDYTGGGNFFDGADGKYHPMCGPTACMPNTTYEGQDDPHGTILRYTQPRSHWSAWGYLPSPATAEDRRQQAIFHQQWEAEETKDQWFFWLGVGPWAVMMGGPEVLEGGMGEGASAEAAEGADAAEGAEGSRVCCFVAGTLVSTLEGLRSIETIKVGDMVLSKDPSTQTTAWKPVTSLVQRHDRDIWVAVFSEVLPDGSTREEQFETTDDHPWRSSESAWVKTADLKTGEMIQTAYGQVAKVVSIRNTGKAQPTYNLEVADFHTYFVGNGRLWVHNEGCGNDAPLGKKSKYSSHADEPNPHPKSTMPSPEKFKQPRTIVGHVLNWIYLLFKLGHFDG